MGVYANSLDGMEPVRVLPDGSNLAFVPAVRGNGGYLTFRCESAINSISPSTISGLKNKRWGVEGDSVLQMLLWLDRTPESFVPGHPGAIHPDALLPLIAGNKILRFDVPSIYDKLDAQRIARGLTWAQVAVDIGGFFRAETLKNMRTQNRTAFPHVMRLSRWLRCPAVALTRVVEW